jgi:hypothetical protein
VARRGEYEKALDLAIGYALEDIAQSGAMLIPLIALFSDFVDEITKTGRINLSALTMSPLAFSVSAIG